MEWTTVDVVMTDHEIVYFEVSDVDDVSLTPELIHRRETTKVALQATRGGKGLRLIDVAAGRKVVGRLDLSEITEVHVERAMPVEDVSRLVEMEGDMDIRNQVASEYWQKSTHVEVVTESRRLRWAKVKEDRLRLVSMHGTLYLRYYSDLNEVEANQSLSEEIDGFTGTLKKDIALQWAQTLVHVCGQDQLKQQLPHFGKNDSEELRDYLEIVYNKSDEMKGHHGRHHRRMSSFGTSQRQLGQKPKSIMFMGRSVSAGSPAMIKARPTEDTEGDSRGATPTTILARPRTLRFAQRSKTVGDPRIGKSMTMVDTNGNNTMTQVPSQSELQSMPPPEFGTAAGNKTEGTIHGMNSIPEKLELSTVDYDRQPFMFLGDCVMEGDEHEGSDDESLFV